MSMIIHYVYMIRLLLFHKQIISQYPQFIHNKTFGATIILTINRTEIKTKYHNDLYFQTVLFSNPFLVFFLFNIKNE